MVELGFGDLPQHCIVSGSLIVYDHVSDGELPNETCIERYFNNSIDYMTGRAIITDFVYRALLLQRLGVTKDYVPCFVYDMATIHRNAVQVEKWSLGPNTKPPDRLPVNRLYYRVNGELTHVELLLKNGKFRGTAAIARELLPEYDSKWKKPVVASRLGLHDAFKYDTYLRNVVEAMFQAKLQYNAKFHCELQP